MLRAIKYNVSFKFIPSRSKAGKGNIYARICIGGIYRDVSTSISVYASEWKEREENALKDILEDERKKIVKICTDLEDALCTEITPENVAHIYAVKKSPNSANKESIHIFEESQEKKSEEKSVIDILLEVVDKKYRSKVIQHTNYKGYKSIISKILLFLEPKKLAQIGYNKFNYTLFEELINFLRTHTFQFGQFVKSRKPLSNAHLRRIAQMIKSGNDYALKKGYTKTLIPQFDSFKNNAQETPFLTLSELKSLENLDLSKDDYLDAIRDIFVFSCYTGFLFCDMKAFDAKKHLETDEKGNTWIIKPREKTSIKQVLPLLPKAKEILDKWEYLPLYCEMSHNRTIKVLARQAGIKKHLTNRVGRKTAGMIWLNEGVSIEVVANMLGHKNIRITQKHYAHIQRERIERETAKLIQPTQAPQETPQSQNIAQENILELLAEAVAQKLKTA